jgi:hypothetical protein
MITINKKLNTRALQKLSVEIWVKPSKEDFWIAKIGKEVEIKCQKLAIQIEVDNKTIKLAKVQSDGSLSIVMKKWTHVAVVFEPKESTITLYINSVLSFQAKPVIFKLPKVPSSLEIGDPGKGVEFTEVRLWRKELSQEEVKENLRMPLEIVAEKRNRWRIKTKEVKKKEEVESGGVNPFSLDF